MRKWENKKDERHWNEEVGMLKAEGGSEKSE
jgi:hypothetical protein